ncbi:hypothetical protein NM208_g11218 [Fusarium decemcellulare]|uniref:Uncharacterized protein n=1 Tax=Fusarium decemcellulare TaxID=57161 RepID=A0ACC1RV66_9HYPO|nr:hypothetical protein NM208_g11218 [Fusarium decemcellulare]
MARTKNTHVPVVTTIVEKAPSHDGTLCIAAWGKVEFTLEKFNRKHHSCRPKLSVQIYDTTPDAADGQHLRKVAEHIHQLIWRVMRIHEPLQGRTLVPQCGRGVYNRYIPKVRYRTEVYALPLPVETPDSIRVERCLSHHKAEIMARHDARDAEFFLQPNFPRGVQDDFWRRFTIITLPQEYWERPNHPFLDVRFERRVDRLCWWDTDDDTGELTPHDLVPEVHVRPYSLRRLERRGLDGLPAARWFYEKFFDYERAELNEHWDWEFGRLNERGEWLSHTDIDVVPTTRFDSESEEEEEEGENEVEEDEEE